MARACVVSLACGLLVALYAAATAVPAVRSSGATADCTGPRRHVETLTDRRARSVNLAPRTTTVAALRRLKVPSRLGGRVRRLETRTYLIKVRMVQMRLEPDGDVLLLVVDPRTHATMFVGFPAPACTRTAGPRVRRAMGAARASLVAACGRPDPGSFTRVGGRATITGVGFVEPGRAPRDAAPNGFELRPVLGFRTRQCLLGG